MYGLVFVGIAIFCFLFHRIRIGAIAGTSKKLPQLVYKMDHFEMYQHPSSDDLYVRFCLSKDIDRWFYARFNPIRGSFHFPCQDPRSYLCKEYSDATVCELKTEGWKKISSIDQMSRQHKKILEARGLVFS